MQGERKENVAYFRGMEGKTATRNARAYTFTFDSEEDKAAYQAHAKRRGLTLAGLIKSLLAADLTAHGPLPEAPPPRA